MNFKPIRHISLFTLAFLIIYSIFVFPQAKENNINPNADSLKETASYEKANNIFNKQRRIDALKSFISEYANSLHKTNALIELFSLYIDNNKVEEALKYADKAIHSAPEQLRIALFNEIAYSLAKKKAGLDTASVYAQRAILESRKNTSNYLNYAGISLDTRALVFYSLGKADSALKLEKEAITFDKDNPAFLSNLAVYQEANGYRLEGIKTAAKAIFFSNSQEALTNFNKWIDSEKPNKKEQVKLKEAIADSIIQSYTEKSKREDKYHLNSTAATFLACIKTNLKQADMWIKEALNSLNDNSPIEDRVAFNKNYASILTAEGKTAEALKVLNSVENIADPKDENFWYVLGKTYERVKKYQKALDSYITGFVAAKPIILRTALIELGAKEGISGNKIEYLITRKQNEFSSFDPGRYKGKKTNGNIVLAELFTCSEGLPCISTNYAFDDLMKYYSRDEVAILEYHVHNPGPDPMTNPDSYKRFLYYGGNFGTPIAFFQGTSKIGGGGPKFLTKNKFNVYKYVLEKYFDKRPDIKLTGSVKCLIDSISVNLHIAKEKQIDNNNFLHVALVEKSLQYPGSSGISNYIFVVRNLFNGANGIPVSLNNKIENITANFKINEIEAGLTKYLTDPSKDPSWPGTFYGRWKKWMNKINRDNLAVVAWVQNNKTKEVLQSVYLDVPGNSLSEKNK